ncbi:hypothetical protein [Pseudophaeobacter sp.]|uniref:hypothetical protein n=1 Tax=Pseudophaeobacter sp. TaxID=1971739 RepID=UPI003297E8F5
MEFIRRGHYTPFLLGLLLGGSLVLISILVFDQTYHSKLRENWIVWTPAIATVIAGLLAGWAALSSTRAQIQQTQMRAGLQREKSLRASKAMLPTILAELARRCEHNAMTVLLNSDNAITKIEEIPPHLKKYIGAEIIPFPTGQEFQSYKECIEFADIDSSKILQQILGSYQVCYSRCHDGDFPSIKRDIDLKKETPTSIGKAFDWNLLYMVISHCFKYARSSETEEKIEETTNKRILALTFSSAIQSHVTRVPYPVSEYTKHAEKLAKTVQGRCLLSNDHIEVSRLLI